METRWITLAHLLRPQGRKGELLAELLTDFPEKFSERRAVSLLNAKGEARAATIEDHWLPVGKNAGRVVLKFTGVDSINDAELLNGLDVVIPEEERAKLEEGAEFVADLVGCMVFNNGEPVGLVDDVEYTAAPPVPGSDGPEAAALLVVKTAEGVEHLIPFVKAYIVTLDTAAKRIEMTLPAGLLELNS